MNQANTPCPNRRRSPRRPPPPPKIAAANDDLVEPIESQALTLSDDEAAAPAPTAAIAAANDEVVEPAESPAVVLSNDDAAAAEVVEPTGPTAMVAAVDEVVVPTESMTAGVSEPRQAGDVALASLRVGEGGTAAATKPHWPANDPLAALYELSEEELVALFC